MLCLHIRLLYLFLVFYELFTTARCQRTDNAFWTTLARQELEEALKVKWNTGVARNVVLFIGDGMGPNTVTATRIYTGGECHRLAYERFPHVGMLKTYSADYMVPDSASTATAMLCGVKVNQNTMGVAATVAEDDCAGSLVDGLTCLTALAQDAGKSTGVVTTMRVTHATPGPMYARSANRRWECDAAMPPSAGQCKDIARQLVEDEVGRNLNVIMGGGRQNLVSNSTATPSDPLDTWSCTRNDGLNLIEVYKQDKESRGLKYSYVVNNRDMQNLDYSETDYLLGIFANGHMKYVSDRDPGPDGTPSLSEMVEAAIGVLRKNDNGFFLMVEGGNIDMAHHRSTAKRAIAESAALEDAVKVAAALTDEEDTLLIVTSDHTHTLTINGHAKRGSDLFGVIEQSASTGTSYTTLTYGTGGPDTFQYYVKNETGNATVARRDPSQDKTDDINYIQQSAVKTAESLHGGGDVMIYARGPQSHLFHNVHEQHYVYHVISYAAGLGARSGTGEKVTVSLVCIAMSLWWSQVVRL